MILCGRRWMKNAIRVNKFPKGEERKAKGSKNLSGRRSKRLKSSQNFLKPQNIRNF